MNIIDEIRNIAEDVDIYDRSLCNRLLDAVNTLESMNLLAVISIEKTLSSELEEFTNFLWEGEVIYANDHSYLFQTLNHEEPESLLTGLPPHSELTLVKLVPLKEVEHEQMD